MKQSSFPCPLAPICDAPALATAPGSVYRAVVVLALAYWRSGCRPLPTDDTTLAALVRLPTSSIRPIKASVLQALSEICPALERDHACQTRAHRYQVAAAERMRAGKVARALQQGLGRSVPVPLPLPHRVTPEPRMLTRAERRPARWHDAGASTCFTD